MNERLQKVLAHAGIQPPHALARREMIIRVGPHRAYVKMARRWAKLGQSSGHRQGASGARSSRHFLTISPLGYVRLS
jgi:hypothetical protein